MWRASDELMSLHQLAKQHGMAVDGAAVETLLCRVAAEPRSHMTAPASPATCAAAETVGAIPSPTSSTYTGPLYTEASPHHRAQSEETSGGGGAGVSSAGLSAMLAGVGSGGGATASSVGGGGGGVDTVMIQLQEKPCSRASPPPRTLLSSP